MLTDTQKRIIQIKKMIKGAYPKYKVNYKAYNSEHNLLRLYGMMQAGDIIDQWASQLDSELMPSSIILLKMNAIKDVSIEKNPYYKKRKNGKRN